MNLIFPAFMFQERAILNNHYFDKTLKNKIKQRQFYSKSYQMDIEKSFTQEPTNFTSSPQFQGFTIGTEFFPKTRCEF